MLRITIVLFVSAIFSSSVGSEERKSPKEYQLTTANHQAYKIYVFEPADAARSGSAVITVHGGGWRWGKAEWTFNAAEMFANAGMLAVAVDYRLSNNDVTPVEALEDVCETLVWVRERAEKLSVNPHKIAAYGVSAGGHLSALAATKGCGNELGSLSNGGPDLLLLWSPALDVERDGWFKKLLLGKSSAADNSPIATLTGAMPPVSVVQGELDSLTPMSGAAEFCEKVEAVNGICELNLYEGVGHLLTRNLENQESDFDPDPKFVKDGRKKLMSFLEQRGFIDMQDDNSVTRENR